MARPTQPQDTPTGECPLERAAALGRLMGEHRAALAALAEQRRAAIRDAHEAHQFKVTVIARRLGVSHGRVSQLLKV